MPRIRLKVLPLLLPLLLAACASSPPTQHLLALPMPSLPPASGSLAQGEARWLQLGRLDIPEYWQSRAVRYREGTELKSWADTVWAERVEVGLTRNLSIELEHALPAPWRLCPLRCEGASLRPVRALVSLSPMDYDRAGQNLTAWAQWTLLGDDGQALRTGSQRLDSTGSGTGAAAQTDAMAGLMKALAELLAREVPRLPAPPAAGRPASSASTSAAKSLDAQHAQ